MALTTNIVSKYCPGKVTHRNVALSYLDGAVLRLFRRFTLSYADENPSAIKLQRFASVCPSPIVSSGFKSKLCNGDPLDFMFAPHSSSFDIVLCDSSHSMSNDWCSGSWRGVSLFFNDAIEVTARMDSILTNACMRGFFCAGGSTVDFSKEVNTQK